MTPLTVVGLILSLGGVAWIAHVLWPRTGGFAAWSTVPLTLAQRRSVCTGLALLNFGIAVAFASLFDLTRGPWDATSLAVLTNLLFIGAAVTFLVLGARLRT